MREPLARGGGSLFLFLTPCQVVHRFAAAGEVADFGKALGDGGVGVVGVGGLLDVVRAVLVDHVEAVVRLAGEFVVHGRGIVAEGLVACHNSHLSDSVCRIAPIMQKKRAVPQRCLPIRKHRGAREKRYSFGYAVFLILALMK